MAVNGFNTGRDVTLDITLADGSLLRPSIRTKFSSKQITASLESKGADGVNRFGEIPGGWEGMFDFDRADPAVDDYFANAEANYYAGIIPQPLTITETITEISGSTSQYRYTGVVLKFDDAGNKGGDAKIEQKVSFKASKRLKVA